MMNTMIGAASKPNVTLSRQRGDLRQALHAPNTEPATWQVTIKPNGQAPFAPTSASPSSVQAQGKRNKLGNYHCNNRVYSIGAGRWLSSDQASSPGWNLQDYVGTRPSQASDPTGLSGGYWVKPGTGVVPGDIPWFDEEHVRDDGSVWVHPWDYRAHGDVSSEGRIREHFEGLSRRTRDLPRQSDPPHLPSTSTATQDGDCFICFFSDFAFKDPWYDVGHAFVGLVCPGDSRPTIRGFYPQSNACAEKGVILDDSTHEWDTVECYKVAKDIATEAMKYEPLFYNVLFNNCDDYVRNIARRAGIADWATSEGGMPPGALPFGGLGRTRDAGGSYDDIKKKPSDFMKGLLQ